MGRRAELMPAVVRKKGKRYYVYSHAGKGARILGRHSSQTKARKQQRAVNASLHKRGKS
jgi:hypothetical protein